MGPSTALPMRPACLQELAKSFLEEDGILAKVADVCGGGYQLLEARGAWEEACFQTCKMGQCKQVHNFPCPVSTTQQEPDAGHD